MVGATESWGAAGVRSPSDAQNGSNIKEAYWLTQWEVQECLLQAQLDTDTVQ